MYLTPTKKQFTTAYFEALIEKYIFNNKVIMSGSQYFVEHDPLYQYICNIESLSSIIDRVCMMHKVYFRLNRNDKMTWAAEFYNQDGVVMAHESYYSIHAVVTAMLQLHLGIQRWEETERQIRRNGFNWDLTETVEQKVIKVDFQKMGNN